MRRLLACLALSVLAACGSDSPTQPANGSVIFKRDALTCTGATANITFFIDGTSVGSEDLAAGGSSKAYAASAGQHTAGARLTNSNVGWPTSNITVPAGNSWTVVLTCS